MPPANPWPSRPTAVLFACNFNRVRSPMAETLLKRLVGDRIYVDSCGIRRPTDGLGVEDESGVDPFTEVVMAELGCDLSQHRTKIFEDLDADSFDLVVSFTPEAQERALEIGRGRSSEFEYWPIPDPTLIEGAREARLGAYREVRDTLAARISERFGGMLRKPST